MCVPVRAHISSRVRPALGRMVFEPRCVISSPPLLPPPHLMGNRCCQGTIFPDHIPHLLFCSPREVVVPTRTRAHPPTPTASPSARLQASLSPTLLTVLGARGKFTKTGLIALKMDDLRDECVRLNLPVRPREKKDRLLEALFRHLDQTYNRGLPVSPLSTTGDTNRDQHAGEGGTPPHHHQPHLPQDSFPSFSSTSTSPSSTIPAPVSATATTPATTATTTTTINNNSSVPDEVISNSIRARNNETGMDLTWLGTSSGSPTVNRNVSCCVLRLPLETDLGLWLFDCGEGTARQLRDQRLQGKFPPKKIRRIFITHLHGDHCFGLPGLLTLIDQRRQGSDMAGEPVYVVGPPGVARIVQSGLSTVAHDMVTPILVTELVDHPQQAHPTKTVGLEGLLCLTRQAPDVVAEEAAGMWGKPFRCSLPYDLEKMEKSGWNSNNNNSNYASSSSTSSDYGGGSRDRRGGSARRSWAGNDRGADGGYGHVPDEDNLRFSDSMGDIISHDDASGRPGPPRLPVERRSSTNTLQGPGGGRTLGTPTGRPPSALGANGPDVSPGRNFTSRDRGSGERHAGYRNYHGNKSKQPASSSSSRDRGGWDLGLAMRRVSYRHQQEVQDYIQAPRCTWTVEDGHGFTVKAAKLLHRLPCWGYVVTERPSGGGLDRARARELGLDREDVIALVKKMRPVVDSAGKSVKLADVVAPTVPGRKVVMLGDTHCSDHIIPLAQGADVLVHEATFADGQESKAALAGHSTARMAGWFARTVQARFLILTHFSPRFAGDASGPSASHASPQSESATGGDVTAKDLMVLRRQAEEECTAQVFAASDFFTFKIPMRTE